MGPRTSQNGVGDISCASLTFEAVFSCTLVRIRKAPHTWRPELVRPTPLICGDCVSAIGTRVSIVSIVGAGSLGICPVMYPRLCVGLTKPATGYKRNQRG